MAAPVRSAVLAAVVGLILSQASSAPAASEKEKAEALARRKTMLTAGRAAFCRVHYYFKRPKDEKGPARDRYDPFQYMSRFRYSGFIDRQMSLLAAGLLLDQAGHVLVGDMHFEEKYIKRIEVVAPDGARYPAKRHKLLDRAPAVLLKITKPLKNWKPPRFVAQAKLGDPGSVFAVSLTRLGREWLLSGHGLGANYPYELGEFGPKRFGVSLDASPFGMAMSRSFSSPFSFFSGMSDFASMARNPLLLCNKQGHPIGAFVSGSPLDPKQKHTDWQHRRLLNGPAITMPEFEKLVERCRADLGKKVHKCRILYRQKGRGRGAMEYRSMMRSRRGYGMGDHRGKEWTTFALAVSRNRLLVPQTITRDQAAKIEKIEVTIQGKVHVAEFVGALKDIGAFLIQLKKGKLPAAADLSPRKQPERMRLFLSVAAEEKFGKKHVRVRPNRWEIETRGYKNRYYISPVHAVPQGAWLVDRKFAVLGVFARQRMEGEELSGFAGRGMSGMMGRNARIFWTADLAPMLAEPVAHFDKQIRHKTEEEAKRIVWLGVEFNPLGRELAKQLKVEKPTKDGTIGLYVNRIYKNSPARRLGIKESDILLRVETRKRPHPIELTSSGDMSEMFSFDWTRYASYRHVEEYGKAKPRWPMRLNYLTILLETIGEGEKIKLTYLHEGKEVSKKFKIELAPRDFVSAGKYKNKEIGLTVKDLTYEVRAGLRLDDAKKAVVVSKIERGSPAQVAKIAPFELITAIDSAPVASAKEFGSRIKQALKAKKKRVLLTVELLGKSRLADLELEQPKTDKKGKPKL